MQRTRFPWAALLVGLAGLLGTTLAGSAERRASADSQPLPAPTATLAAVRPAGNRPDDVQRLLVTVEDGRFQSNVYPVQTRPTRLIVRSADGPYTLIIDRVLGPRQLPADGTREFRLTLPTPGEYRMTLAGNATDVAILDVRPLGDR